jgi:hypothetical protein
MSKSQRTKTDRTGQLEIFPTPSWAVDRLLDCLKPKTGMFFEPCAGEGHIVRAVDAWFKRNRPGEALPTWEHTDIRETRYAQPPSDMTQQQNFFTGRSFDVILTNPPFSKAFDLFSVLWPLTQRSLVFLLPMSWLGSSDRTNLLRSYTPSLFVLPERPVYRIHSSTDQETYAWYVWSRRPIVLHVAGAQQGLPLHGMGFVRILDATPAAVRRASEAEAFAAMPADWHREAEERAAERKAREKARRSGA